MGQARQRGTPEQRKSMSLAKKIAEHQPPSPPKFCVQCVQYAPAESKEDAPRCHVGQMVDIVSGVPFWPTCIDMRTQGPCGNEAAFYQPRPIGGLDKAHEGSERTHIKSGDETGLN